MKRIVFLICFGGLFFFSFLIYRNFNSVREITKQPQEKKQQQTPIDTKIVLGVQKVASAASQSQEIPTKPAGFCLTVPVLLYHHVEPYDQAKREGHDKLTIDVNYFDKQMQYLAERGYKSITAEELANAIVGHNNLGKAVVVTLDDGYVDAYTYAYPIAKKYKILLNLMIPTGLLNNPGYMTWGNLKEMVNSGMAFAYDHTWSHYSLPRGDEKKEETEIMTAKNQLEQNLGKTVRIFTYPYGSSNQQAVNILQRNGFIAAFSTIPGFYQCDSFIFNLHRNRVGNAPLSSYGL